MKIDMKELRDSMENYYGTAMFSGFPMAGVDLIRVQNMSDEELLRKALRDNVDLSPFLYPDDSDGDCF